MDTLLASPALPVQGVQLRPRGRKRTDAVWHLWVARWWICEATVHTSTRCRLTACASVETNTPP